MASIFLERKLPDLPSSRRKTSTDGGKSDAPDVNKTYVVNLARVKVVDEDEGKGRQRKSKWTEFKEVRRKLAFFDEEEDKKKIDPLDFTEKMAAFRTLLKRDALRESARNSERGFKMSSANVGSASDYNILQNGDINSEKMSEIKSRLPKAKETKQILSKLADEELAKMSLLNLEAQLYLDKHKSGDSHRETINRFSGKLDDFVKSTKREKTANADDIDVKTDKNSNANDDDYLAKFLQSEANQNSPPQISKSRKSSRQSSRHGNHDSDSDLDKIPQKESGSQKAYSCDIDTKCQKPKSASRPVSEAGSSLFDAPLSVRRAANRSIQSNVPHYHPSFPVASRDPPMELLESTKGKNEEGLCRGVRTGEVIITKVGAGTPKQSVEDLQTHLKSKDKG